MLCLLSKSSLHQVKYKQLQTTKYPIRADKWQQRFRNVPHIHINNRGHWDSLFYQQNTKDLRLINIKWPPSTTEMLSSLFSIRCHLHPQAGLSCNNKIDAQRKISYSFLTLSRRKNFIFSNDCPAFWAWFRLEQLKVRFEAATLQQCVPIMALLGYGRWHQTRSHYKAAEIWQGSMRQGRRQCLPMIQRLVFKDKLL